MLGLIGLAIMEHIIACLFLHVRVVIRVGVCPQTFID